MADAPVLDPQFVRFLRDSRRMIVPFTGAGVSADAGVPVADELALLIASAANERDAGIEARNDFAGVCADVTAALGRGILQEIIATVVSGLDARPTPLLRLLARTPSRIVLTSNWDDALEKAAAEVGRSPRVFEPRMAGALGQPAEAELYVVHLHGMATAPDSIVMPGEFLDHLPEDEAFITGLRALLAPHTLLYLGYRFPPEDAYLREELRWLAENMRDTREHALLVPKRELDARPELRQLEDANFLITTFDSSQGYEAVQQAALIIAPQSGVSAAHVARRPDRGLTPYYRPAPLVGADDQRSREEIESAIELARAGLGELPYVELGAIREAGRAVLVGEPGSGKSELLLQLARSSDPPHLYVRLPELATTLLDGDLDQAFARAMSSAAAITDAVPIPTREALRTDAYVILLDGFDELADPELRVKIAERVDEMADRWPQHFFVVASRPVPERSSFPDEKWTSFRLLGDASWGRSYLLEARGIPEARFEQLVDQFPRARELIAIPLYATLIGDRLSRDDDLPDTALRLITDVGVRDALAREAAREGLERDDVYRYLKTLAVGMELRGLNRAEAADLVVLPAPEGLAVDSVRERLIEQALLRDVPGVAEFQAVSVQEALAAEALLETADPIETLRRVALVEVAGEEVLRPDIDHTLDLLFEAAPAELRARLRDLDELRFARTQPITIDVADAEETLRFIWTFFNDLKVWVDSDRSRELRDARAAVERLASAFPQAIEAMREELLAALDSREETQRGNAVFFLEQLDDDPGRVDWLPPRLTDDNSVVRRWAAEVVRRHRVTELRQTLADDYRAEHDELAASALGSALLALSDEDERVATGRILLENPIGWSRLSYTVRRLPPGDVVSILEHGDLRRWEDERLLSELLEETPDEAWDESDVERLVALTVRESSRRAVHIRGIETVARLSERYPDAALRGAAAGASDQTLWADLWFLRGLPRETLEATRAGDLAAPLSALLDRLELVSATEMPAAQAAPVDLACPEQRLADWIDAGKIDRDHCVHPDGPLDRFLDQVDTLTEQQRDTLTDYVRSWWPEVPLSEALTTDGRQGQRPICFDAALGFHAALSLSIDRDRWLEAYESNAVWFERRAASWMAAQYPGDELADRVVAHVVALEDPSLVSIALDSLPAITPTVADAAARALAAIDSDSSCILDRFRQANQLDALRYLHENARSEMTGAAARRELAAAGDLEAQRAELQTVRDAVEAGSNFRHSSPEWLSAAGVELLPQLEEVLVAVSHRVGPSEWDLGRALASTLERLGDEAAVAIYDRLIADHQAVDGSFYWHQRDNLIGEIARRRVLAELPSTPVGVVTLLEDLGYPSRDSG